MDITLKPFGALEMNILASELEQTGRQIIHFEIGDPDFQTPHFIKTAAIEAIQNGATHYTDPMGMIELRRALCDFYLSCYGVDIYPEQILITAGASQALLYLMMVLLKDNDKVIIQDPCYPAYCNFITACEGDITYAPTNAEDGFKLNRKIIEKCIDPNTKAVIINSPSNPTGTVLSGNELREIASVGNIYFISDETYHGLYYKDKLHTLLEYTKNAFVINSFSKTFAMTGWRIGYLIFPKEFTNSIRILQSSFSISTNSFSQIAALTAITKGWRHLERARTLYDMKRKYMIFRLRKMGFFIHTEPVGAFYVFADGRKHFNDSSAASIKLLHEYCVATAPGVDFGAQGEGFLRFSYANSFSHIVEGLNRVGCFLKNL